MKIIINFTFLGLILSSFNVLAVDSKYTCTINQVIKLSDDGKFKDDDGVHEQLIGEQFTIDRNSGTMKGLPFSTESYRDTMVFEKGGLEMSYKAITISHPPHTWTMYIEVREFKKGRLKPFWGHDGSHLFSGQCKYL